MSAPTIREVQLFELQMLKDVAKVCNENNIDYMLACGTLLGAVRHGGFIPWDDDIDLYMTPKNYTKFIKIGQEALGDKYFIQNWRTEKNYPFLWTQIRANGTTSMPVASKNLDIHWGVCLDIFPVIGRYNSGLKRKLQSASFGLSKALLAKDYILAMNEKAQGKQKLINLLPYRVRKTLCKLMQPLYLCDIKKNNQNEACVLWYDFSDFFPSLLLNERTKIKFENGHFTTMKDYKDYLSAIYGDYMTPPPIEEQKGHEGTLGEIIIDLNRDYMQYKS